MKAVINDGRNYLQNTTERFDLIIFALPDSLTLTSSNTSLRLESFLLTQESIEAARARLTSDGLVVLYNYYRDQWLVEKLANMAGHAFNQEPLVSTYGGWGRAAVIMVGPRLKELPPGKFGPYKEQDPAPGDRRLRVIGEGYFPLTGSTPATDDWPFLYLREHSFALIYVVGLGMVALFALSGTLTLAPRGVLRRFDWHMFFLVRQHLAGQLAGLLRHPQQCAAGRAGEQPTQGPAHQPFLPAAVRRARRQSPAATRGAAAG